MAALGREVVCTQENTQCVNADGSFECVCVPGYELTDRNCQRNENDYLNGVTFFFNSGIIEVIEPPQVIIPAIGRENAVSYIVLTYEIKEVTNALLLLYSVIIIYNYVAHSTETTRISCSNISSHYKILFKI